MRRSSMHWPILRCDSASSISDRIHQRARSKPRKRCAPSTRPKFRNGGRSSRRPTSGRNEPAEIVERLNRDNPDTNRELNFGRLVIMLVVSLVAALFGFTGLAAASADVARILFYVFLVIFLVLLVLGLVGARAAR